MELSKKQDEGKRKTQYNVQDISISVDEAFQVSKTLGLLTKRLRV